MTLLGKERHIYNRKSTSSKSVSGDNPRPL